MLTISLPLAALAGLCGCAGSGVDMPVGGGGGGATTLDGLSGPGPRVAPFVSPAVRYAAMDRVRAKYNALVAAHVKDVQRELQLVAYMKTLTEFKKSGLFADGTIWGRFSDNSFYMFNDRAVPDDFVPPPAHRTGAPVPTSIESGPSLTTPRAVTAGLEVVNSRKAYLFDVFDGSMGTPNTEIADMLKKRGYQVTGGPATLEALRNVKDAGVLYMSSHGCQASHPLNPTQSFWSVWTSTDANPENDAKYANDIAAGRIVVFEAPYGKEFLGLKYVARRYAITAEWVKYYGWTFSNRSMAFINCCWSDKGGFTGALRSLPKPVSTTFGWSNAAHPEKAWRAARYLFDRALGTNMADPILEGGARPFPTDDVFAKEASLGWADGTTTQYGACRLVQGGVNALLAPSIKRMEVYERGMDPAAVEPKLVLYGQLGTELPNFVKIQGVPVSGVTIVSDTEWRCTIPASVSPGFAGRVEITTAQNIKSNTPLLTSWQGTFQYRGAPLSQFGNNVRGTMDMKVALRADVHRYRDTVDGDLQQPLPAYSRATIGSTCNWAITGALQGWIYVSPTSGVMPYGLRQNGTQYGTGYVLDAKFDRKAGTIGIAFDYLGTNVDYKIPPAPQTFTILIPRDNLLVSPYSMGTDKFGAPVYPTKVFAQLRPDFKVEKQIFNGSAYNQFATQMEVPAMTPQYIPSDNAEEDWPN